MIQLGYRVGPSLIAGAGNGLFLLDPVARGKVIIAPDRIHTVWPEARLRSFPPGSIEVESSVRWFEDWFSLTPEWSDECFVNHSFRATGLWHLGFIFAIDDLAAGSELTVDYRLVIGDGERMPFLDGESGRPIVGLPWREALLESTLTLQRLMA